MSEHSNSMPASLVSDPSVPLADSIRIALSDDILAGVISAGNSS
ncbi:hypothetical protein ABDK09_03805 [Vibrio sp. CDRSL-10 TSBA]